MEKTKSKDKLTKAQLATKAVEGVLEGTFLMNFERKDSQTVAQMKSVIESMLVLAVENGAVKEYKVYTQKLENKSIGVAVFYKIATKTSNWYLIEGEYNK